MAGARLLELERSAPIVVPEAEDAPVPAEKRPTPLVCRKCGHLVTNVEAQTSVHVRTNPSGVTFEFGCFSDAPGAMGAGERTSEATWFPGYTWRHALCGGCRAHLGWLFEGGGAAPFDGLRTGFWGLILNRLTAPPG